MAMCPACTRPSTVRLCVYQVPDRRDHLQQRVAHHADRAAARPLAARPAPRPRRQPPAIAGCAAALAAHGLGYREPASTVSVRSAGSCATTRSMPAARTSWSAGGRAARARTGRCRRSPSRSRGPRSPRLRGPRRACGGERWSLQPGARVRSLALDATSPQRLPIGSTLAGLTRPSGSNALAGAGLASNTGRGAQA